MSLLLEQRRSGLTPHDPSRKSEFKIKKINSPSIITPFSRRILRHFSGTTWRISVWRALTKSNTSSSPQVDSEKRRVVASIMVLRKKTKASSRTDESTSDLPSTAELLERAKTAPAATTKTKRRQTSLRNFFGTAAGKTKRTVSFQENQSKKTATGFCPLTPPTPVSPPQTPLTPPTAQEPPVETPPSPDTVPVVFKKPKRDTTVDTQKDDASRTDEPLSQKNRPQKKALEQTYLDLGQGDFGKRTICNTCGMLYVHGLNEDSQQHSRICMDYMKGVPFNAPQARVVATDLKGSIVEVRRD